MKLEEERPKGRSSCDIHSALTGSLGKGVWSDEKTAEQGRRPTLLVGPDMKVG